jgi:hypothetical protein
VILRHLWTFVLCVSVLACTVLLVGMKVAG